MEKSQFIGRDYLKLADYTPDELLYMVDVSADLKARLKRREPHQFFPNNTAAALFEKIHAHTHIFSGSLRSLGDDEFLHASRGDAARARGTDQ